MELPYLPTTFQCPPNPLDDVENLLWWPHGLLAEVYAEHDKISRRQSGHPATVGEALRSKKFSHHFHEMCQ